MFWIVKLLLPKKEERSAGSGLGGAVVGAVVGLVVAIALVWSFAFVRDMRPVNDPTVAEQQAPSAPSEETSKSSAVETFAQQVASKAVDAAMSAVSDKPQVAKLSSALIRAPAETAQQLKRLANSDELRQLLNSADNQAVLNSGDTEAVQQLPAFQQLVQSPDMIALAKASGMLDEAATNTREMQDALAGQVTDIWGRMQRVKNNARVQEILNDPEFQQGVQSGNPMALLTNPKLLEFADIVFADEAATDSGDFEGNGLRDGQSTSDNANKSSQSTEPQKETKIYRWVDENGRVHFSDQEQGR